MASSRHEPGRDDAHYRPEMGGLKLAHGISIHISGTDLVRDRDGRFRVLEDNGRKGIVQLQP
jgi:uncharacterized circularly permuted ATP-grasp superfamily protein